MLRSEIQAFLLSALCAFDLRAQRIELKNSSFELARDSLGTLPASWIAGPGASLVSSKARLGARSLRISPLGNDSVVAVVQTFRADAYVGQTVELSGDIEVQQLSGWAGLWIRIDGKTRTLAVDNMEKTGPRGTKKWTRYTARAPIPIGAERIMVGALHVGRGVSWFDNLDLQICALGPSC